MPIENATTSSLEALKAFSLGDVQRKRGADTETVPFYERAVEIDPDFAMAHARLAAVLVNELWVPSIRAAIEMARGHPAEAVELLRPAGRYELGWDAAFRPTYIRGQAYLALRAGPEAAREFQKILDHRGSSVTSLRYPLALLGLGRSAALAGDTARSRRAYQDFLALWKDADPDVPVLQQARAEYARLE